MTQTDDKERIQIIERLSDEEQAEFTKLLKVARTGIESFRKAGEALSIIREKRLYREKYKNFDDFCKEEFQLTRMHAGRLISAYDIVKRLKEHGEEEHLPQSESVARELARAPEEQRDQVWKRAVELAGEREPASGDVRQAVIEVLPEEHRSEAEKLDALAKLRSAERQLRNAQEILGEDISDVEGLKLVVDILSSIGSIARELKRNVLNAMEKEE